jgi:rRNA maturation RNase YbeY
MNEITLYKTGVRIETPSKVQLQSWVKEIAKKHKKKTGSINFVVCSDDYLLKINQDFLNHDYYTDIITFDYSEDNILNGEIYISADRVRENAIENHQKIKVEMLRVMAHGVLHMIGFQDKSKNQVLEMRQNEELCISLFFTKFAL